MTRIALVFVAALIAKPCAAQEISSAYTDFTADRDCAIYAQAREGEGEWANGVCSGYRGYPVYFSYGDARESLFYGFPPVADLAMSWGTFSAFNTAGPKIEWRLATENGVTTPFAAIQRWFVQPSEESTVEVLVVSKVGAIDAREGCPVGFVVATGNPAANQAARKIADENVRPFSCASDEPTRIGGAVPVPDFSGAEKVP